MNSLCTLIVDDSSVMRKIIERFLREAGLEISEVMEARNGEEALAAIRDKRPDLILTDLNMPIMSGVEFIRRLQNISGMENVPVVMITTEANESRVAEALAYGAKTYLSKPFTPGQIRERILPLLKKNASEENHFPPVKMTPNWTIYVRESLQDVFSVMLNMKVTPCEGVQVVPELTALVGLAGSLCGLFSLRCTQDTAANLACKMLQTDAPGCEEHVFDALGEICNMVAGSFKARLYDFSDTCMLSIPAIVSGEDYSVHPPSGGQTLQALVRCDEFPVEVVLHLNA